MRSGSAVGVLVNIVGQASQVVLVTRAMPSIFRLNPQFIWGNYGAQYTTFRSFAKAQMPVVTLKCNHYKFGLVPLDTTEHFELFSAYKTRDLSRIQKAELAYGAYLRNYYRGSDDTILRQIKHANAIFEAFANGAQFQVAISPTWEREWQIVDGLHRAAVVAAMEPESDIGVTIVWR